MNRNSMARWMGQWEFEMKDPGASGTIYVSKDRSVCNIVTAAAETRTLDRPTKAGQYVTLHHRTDGGDCTLTVTGGYDEDGTTTLTFGDAGEVATFISIYTGSAYIWRLIDLNRASVVNVTASTLTLSRQIHHGRLVTLNRAAGIAVTLPAATGSGSLFRLFLGTTVTSNSTTITRAGSDTMFGMVYQLADGGSTLAAYECPGSTVITLNGSTTGGIKGDYFELEDVASATWRIIGHTSATGVEATPVT